MAAGTGQTPVADRGRPQDVPGVRPDAHPTARSDHMEKMRRTVVIVDDHAVFRASARRLLELEGYDVVGEAEDAASALAAVESLQPGVVLLDVVLPDASGLDIAGALSRHGAQVVLISSRDATDLGPRLGRCGATGFIPKNELSAERLEEILSGPGARHAAPGM